MGLEKGLLSSVTAWGGLVAIAPLLNEIVKAVPEATAIVAGAAGGLLAIWGRIRAKSKIKGIL